MSDARKLKAVEKPGNNTVPDELDGLEAVHFRHKSMAKRLELTISE
jgi:hypothetical protein